jgi:tRNA dimethylallyltransferase
MTEKLKVVFIFGPTGVGKTDLALRVAQGIGEIISVDSMQVYKELEKGTAKPDNRALQSVPHHLVSIVSPDYRFSAGDFKNLASRAIYDIHHRGKIPILVGGTGLYFRALEYSLSDAPSADLELRKILYCEEEKEKGSLYVRLKSVDPKTARTLHPNDLVRIIRALEVHELSRKKFSDFKNGGTDVKFDALKIGLNIDRDELYKRLADRCKKMISGGLAGEVFGLLSRGYDERFPSMKGLGYSHFIQYFKGCRSFNEVIRLFIRDTKRYAKRQLTWFRREKGTILFRPTEYRSVRERIEHFAGF